MRPALQGKNMKAHHYLAIGIKLFAIILIVYSIKQSEIIFDILFNENSVYAEASPTVISLNIVIPILISIGLWFFPGTIAKSILTPDLDQPVEPLSPNSFLAALISGIGLFVLFNATIDIIYWSIFNHLVSEMGMYGAAKGDLTPDAEANIWATGFEFVFSLILIFKSKSIAHLILKVAK